MWDTSDFEGGETDMQRPSKQTRTPKLVETPAWTFGPHELVGGLLDYAEKFADLNGEPNDSACRESIRKGLAWFESGSSTVDPKSVCDELVEYVQRYAEMNDEPEGGNCKRLLAFAEHRFGVRKPKATVVCCVHTEDGPVEGVTSNIDIAPGEPFRNVCIKAIEIAKAHKALVDFEYEGVSHQAGWTSDIDTLSVLHTRQLEHRKVPVSNHEQPVNWLVQDADWMPVGSKFRLIKTRLEIGLTGHVSETDVGLRNEFATEYFPTHKAASIRRDELVAQAINNGELVIGVKDFVYLNKNEVSEWLYDQGRLIGIENHEAWFDTLSKADQSAFKIEYMVEKFKAERNLRQAGIDTLSPAIDHVVKKQKTSSGPRM